MVRIAHWHTLGTPDKLQTERKTKRSLHRSRHCDPSRLLNDLTMKDRVRVIVCDLAVCAVSGMRRI